MKNKPLEVFGINVQNWPSFWLGRKPGLREVESILGNFRKKLFQEEIRSKFNWPSGWKFSLASVYKLWLSQEKKQTGYINTIKIITGLAKPCRKSWKHSVVFFAAKHIENLMNLEFTLKSNILRVWMWLNSISNWQFALNGFHFSAFWIWLEVEDLCRQGLSTSTLSQSDLHQLSKIFL